MLAAKAHPPRTSQSRESRGYIGILEEIPMRSAVLTASKPLWRTTILRFATDRLQLLIIEGLQIEGRAARLLSISAGKITGKNDPVFCYEGCLLTRLLAEVELDRVERPSETDPPPPLVRPATFPRVVTLGFLYGFLAVLEVSESSVSPFSRSLLGMNRLPTWIEGGPRVPSLKTITICT